MAMPSCSFPIQTIGSRHLAQGTVALHHAGQLFVRMNVIYMPAKTKDMNKEMHRMTVEITLLQWLS